MRIELEQVAKRYRREWILRRVTLIIEAGKRYAIEGPNGSGKSTLLRMLSGHLSPTKGTIKHLINDRKIDPDEVYRHLAYAAPYIELIEELTLQEGLRFHARFQAFLPGLDQAAIIDLLALPGSANKPIRHFSSGMKQRLKLALAICSDTPLLLLDEPTTNLDQQGIDWYLALIDRFIGERTVVVASNVAVDFGFCEGRVGVLQYKQSGK